MFDYQSDIDFIGTHEWIYITWYKSAMNGKGTLMRSGNDVADMGRWRQIIINSDTKVANIRHNWETDVITKASRYITFANVQHTAFINR